METTRRDIPVVVDEGSDATERARRIMEDRFGLSLPAPRCHDANVDDEDNSYARRDDDMRTCVSPDLRTSTEHDEVRTKNAVDDDNHHPDAPRNAYPISHVVGRPGVTDDVMDVIFGSMPPRVRAVAERRPDLVSRLLSSRKDPRRGSVFWHHRNQHAAVATSSRLALGDDIPPQSEEEISMDQESVCLLRRRNNNSKYNY